MVASLTLLLVLTGAAPPAGPATVFVASLQARGGVTADQAALLSGALVREVSLLPGLSVVTTRDIEQVLSQEKLRQLLDCDTQGCALEMAGQLNARDLVFGDLGRLGGTWVLSVTRVRASDATALGRISTRWSGEDPAQVLPRLPALVRSLFGVEPARGTSRLPLLTLAGSGAAAALALATGLVAMSMGSLGLSVVLQDVAGGGRPFVGPHAVTATQGMISNAALGGFAGLALLSVVLVATAVALVVSTVTLRTTL